MVITDSTDCPRVQPAALVADRAVGTAPLLTDRRTAAAMNVPHTILASGAALVPNAQVPSLNAAPVVLAATASRTETVITEMHNPPLTVVQVGSMVVSPLR